MEMLIHLKIILTSTTLTFLPLMEMEKMISSLLKYLEEYTNVQNSLSITDGDKYNSYQQETTSDGMEEIV